MPGWSADGCNGTTLLDHFWDLSQRKQSVGWFADKKWANSHFINLVVENWDLIQIEENTVQYPCTTGFAGHKHQNLCDDNVTLLNWQWNTSQKVAQTVADSNDLYPNVISVSRFHGMRGRASPEGSPALHDGYGKIQEGCDYRWQSRLLSQ